MSCCRPARSSRGSAKGYGAAADEARRWMYRPISPITVLSVLSDAAQLTVLVVGGCINGWVILSPRDLGSGNERPG